VLNGLLGRDDLNEALQLPIGIVPAGSDNSLVWTVLGIRDPVSAATALAKVILCQSVIIIFMSFTDN
jgi:diacylglycerol kinase family enzyme